jgi:hypothetical protein
MNAEYQDIIFRSQIYQVYAAFPRTRANTPMSLMVAQYTIDIEDDYDAFAYFDDFELIGVKSVNRERGADGKGKDFWIIETERGTERVPLNAKIVIFGFHKDRKQLTHNRGSR